MSSDAGWDCAILSDIPRIKEPHLKHLNLSGNQHDSLDLLVN